MFLLVVGMQVMFQTVDRLHVEENDDESSAVHTPGLGFVGGCCCFPMPLILPERFTIIERFNTPCVYIQDTIPLCGNNYDIASTYH